MITQKKANANTFETNVEDGGSVFGIANSAKIFNMLISGLYENKVQSIVREVWSNAYDSHIEAGIPEKPFFVKLPSMMDSTFRVRDYGVSITHEQAITLYKTLGESTKEDKDDPIGKWGIGSKSPFAYTDSFNVTAYLNGEMRVYSCVINDADEPTLTTIAKMPTDEPDGLEVSFAVQPGDISAFHRAAARVGFGFDVKPEIQDDAFNWLPDNPTYTGTNWKFYTVNPFDRYTKAAFVRMGPVLYPVKREAIADYITAEQSALLDYMLIIDVPMGSCEPTPSREALQYSNRFNTIQTISNALQNILDEMVRTAKKAIENAPTKYDAGVLLRKSVVSYDMPGFLRSALEKGTMYKGAKLLPEVSFPDSQMLRFRSLRIRGCSEFRRKRMTPPHDFSRVRLPYNENVVFYLDDGSVKRQFERIKQDANGKDAVVYWVRIDTKKKSDVNTLFTLMDHFDGAEFINVSDIELPEAVKASYKRTYSPPKVEVFTSGYYTTTRDLTQEEYDAGGYYVRTERGYCMEKYDAAVAAKALIQLGATDKVIRLPKTYWKRFERADNWVLLEELIEQNRASDKIIDKIKAVMMEQEQRRIVVNPPSFLRFVISNRNKEFAKIGSFKDFLDWYNTKEMIEVKLTDKEKAYSLLEDAVGARITIDEKDESMRQEMDEWDTLLTREFPIIERMVAHLNSWHWNKKDFDSLVDYVTMVHNSKANQAVKIAA